MLDWTLLKNFIATLQYILNEVCFVWVQKQIDKQWCTVFNHRNANTEFFKTHSTKLVSICKSSIWTICALVHLWNLCLLWLLTDSYIAKYCSGWRSFWIIKSELLSGISNVCCELCLLYMSVLYCVTFVVMVHLRKNKFECFVFLSNWILFYLWLFYTVHKNAEWQQKCVPNIRRCEGVSIMFQ